MKAEETQKDWQKEKRQKYENMSFRDGQSVINSLPLDDHLQGVFFNWSPPKFSKYKSLYNPWHLEKLWASLHGILYLENLGRLQLKQFYL